MFEPFDGIQDVWQPLQVGYEQTETLEEQVQMVLGYSAYEVKGQCL